MAFSGGMRQDRKEFEKEQKKLQKMQRESHKRLWRNVRKFMHWK